MFGRITQTECTDGYLQRNVQKDISHGMYRMISPTECTKGYLQQNVCTGGYLRRNVL